MLGGGDAAHIVGFNNISMHDKTEQKWYSQVASGQVPDPIYDYRIVAFRATKAAVLRCKVSFLICILPSKQEP